MATPTNEFKENSTYEKNRQPMPRAMIFFGVRQNDDSAGDGICFQHYWTKLCIFDVFMFFAFLSYFIFVLSMHFVELSHASHS